MREEGKITHILNRTFALAEYNGSLIEGDIVSVFSKLIDAKVKEAGLDEIIVPKGKLVVVAKQNNDTYLLRSGEITEKNVVTSPMINPLGSLFKSETIVVTDKKDAAILDNSQSLGFKINLAVVKGDFICKA